ncbi:MAG: type II toxin-antitoxin system mRNA interferase toxin, RelE/StbE family [Gammaproteobacteria bacterium]|nr:type II toxin-antitoxin system mRNA interferase toxin, RelE/StbE family [Gammaproteobacteria bacterium]
MSDIYKVNLSKQAKKNIDKAPDYIAIKFQAWVEAVAEEGLMVVRKRKGYHDEPLKGERRGQRSIRLSRAYRAIYEIKKMDGREYLQFIEVKEVNKHEY